MSCSPVVSPLIRDRGDESRWQGLLFFVFGLRINVDYREVSNSCRVAPSPPVAEEEDFATSAYDTTLVEPVATPAPPSFPSL